MRRIELHAGVTATGAMTMRASKIIIASLLAHITLCSVSSAYRILPGDSHRSHAVSLLPSGSMGSGIQLGSTASCSTPDHVVAVSVDALAVPAGNADWSLLLQLRLPVPLVAGIILSAGGLTLKIDTSGGAGACATVRNQSNHHRHALYTPPMLFMVRRAPAGDTPKRHLPLILSGGPHSGIAGAVCARRPQHEAVHRQQPGHTPQCEKSQEMLGLRQPVPGLYPAWPRRASLRAPYRAMLPLHDTCPQTPAGAGQVVKSRWWLDGSDQPRPHPHAGTCLGRAGSCAGQHSRGRSASTAAAAVDSACGARVRCTWQQRADWVTACFT